MGAWCGGCRGKVRDACRGCFARRDVVKVHWECWSECNLSCSFCFRMRGTPLATLSAARLVGAIATSGARTIAFAGGDPTLRRDLGLLVTVARAAGLRVEIQTNAQAVHPHAWEGLRRADRVCLSLDGPTPETHDSIRSRRGNFQHVLRTANALGEAGVPITVRTLISRRNAAVVAQMAPLVASLPTCERWTLLEFTPVNDGFVNRTEHEMPRGGFEDTVAGIVAAHRGGAEIDVSRHAAKVGAYVQVTPDGLVYGTTEKALFRTGTHDIVGSMMTDHLSEVCADVPLDARRHLDRYAWEVARPVPAGATDA